MTDSRPRSFVWLEHNGQPLSQIWFDDPRIGCEGLSPIAERRLDPSEYALTLKELVERYPALPKATP